MNEGDPDGHLPQVAVDQQGNVHVIWAAWTGSENEKPFPEALNTFMYRRLDKNGWSPVNDILVAPENGAFVPGSLIVDDEGFLNLTWVDLGRSRKVFLSRAHVLCANMAPAWATITIDVPQIAASYPHLITDYTGAFHLVYARDNRFIVYMTSTNHGKTWSNPVTVWSVAVPNREAVANPRLAVDSRGYLHIVWTVNGIERNWQGVAVFYARSTDGGLSWAVNEVQRSQPDESTVAWINIVVRFENEIHLTWNRGIGSLRGRYHSWSADNGETWSEPTSFFPPNESGQTHWPWMVVDSAGTIHLVSKTGAGINPGAPKYIYWDGISWSGMYTFSETQNDLDSALAIGLGNTLHLVHATETGRGRLVYRTLTTKASAIPLRPVPTPEACSTLALSTVLQDEALEESGRRNLPSSDVSRPDFDITQPHSPFFTSGSQAVLLLAVGSTLLLIATVIVVRYSWRGKLK
jgi:hypothetical protein